MMQEPTTTQSLLPDAENPDMSYTLVIDNESEKGQQRGGWDFRIFAIILGAITLAGVLAFGSRIFARVEPAQTPQTLSLQEYLSQKRAARPLSREPRSMLYPNLETLGRGYDIFRGDPRSPGVTPDPGIMHNFPIFAVANENTPGVQIVTGERCSTSFQSRTIFGMNSYRDALATSVGVNTGVSGILGMFGGSFSASHSWSEVRSGTESRRNVLVESTAECSFYTASIVPPTRWSNAATPLSADFRDALDWLTSILFPSERDYHDVLDFFGTHAMFNNMRMGSLVGTRSEVSERSFTSHFQDSREFETSASFSAGFVTFGTDISRRSDRERTAQFDANTERRESFTIGTSPLRQSWSSGDVRSNPAPIAFDLLDIATIVDRFSNLPTSGVVMDRATVVRGFRNALERRCSRLRTSGVRVQCGDLSPDRIP